MPLNEFTQTAQKALNQALRGAASNHDQLQSWASANMPDMGTGLVAGSIIWNKPFGRPSTQKLCDGFTISLVVHTLVDVGTPGDSGPVEKWFDTTIPVDKKWDDSDREKYLVHFLHEKLSGTRVSVVVAIADGVGWQDASGGRSLEHLIVSPSKREYGYKLPHPIMPTWIEPFRVIRALDSASAYRML